jgi:hypothetical protein
MSRNPPQVPLPNATQQTIASLALENTALRGCIQAVEDENHNVQGILMELQDRDEALQSNIQE